MYPFIYPPSHPSVTHFHPSIHPCIHSRPVPILHVHSYLPTHLSTTITFHPHYCAASTMPSRMLSSTNQKHVKYVHPVLLLDLWHSPPFTMSLQSWPPQVLHVNRSMQIHHHTWQNCITPFQDVKQVWKNCGCVHEWPNSGGQEEDVCGRISHRESYRTWLCLECLSGTWKSEQGLDTFFDTTVW